MKFRLIVIDERHDEPFTEDYDKPEIETLAEALEWAEEIIESYNRTLRPYEVARKLVRVENRGISEEHYWNKTSLVTIVSKSGNYDEMECTKCGITGRRYGLSTHVRRDQEFSAEGYGNCLQATKLLTRRQKRRDTIRRKRDA